MSFNIVSFFSGGYLYATAHLGTFVVTPISSLCAKLSTLTTAPSISNFSSPLLSPISLIAANISFTVLHFFKYGDITNPCSSKYFND